MPTHLVGKTLLLTAGCFQRLMLLVLLSCGMMMIPLHEGAHRA